MAKTCIYPPLPNVTLWFSYVQLNMAAWRMPSITRFTASWSSITSHNLGVYHQRASKIGILCVLARDPSQAVITKMSWAFHLCGCNAVGSRVHKYIQISSNITTTYILLSLRITTMSNHSKFMHLVQVSSFEKYWKHQPTTKPGPPNTLEQ